MEAARTSETSVYYEITQRYVPKECHLRVLSVFENSVLGRIFDLKTDEVTENWE
jgi:hypothetical protein